jgi:hypothetical protein
MMVEAGRFRWKRYRLGGPAATLNVDEVQQGARRPDHGGHEGMVRPHGRSR